VEKCFETKSWKTLGIYYPEKTLETNDVKDSATVPDVFLPHFVHLGFTAFVLCHIHGKMFF
jgi:hypothetical protein